MAHADEEFKAVTVPQQIFMTLEDPAFVLPIFPKLPKLISNFIMSLIVLGCITYVMESMPMFNTMEDECKDSVLADDIDIKEEQQIIEGKAGLCVPEPLPFFMLIESVCIYIFTVEYVLRLFTVHTVPEKVWNIKEEALEEPDDDDEVHVKHEKGCFGLTKGYATTFMNLIDLVAILPFYLEAAIGDTGLGVIRVLRLTRVLRVLKSPKFAEAVKLFSLSLSLSIPALSILFFFNILGIILMGSLVFFFESGKYSIRDDVCCPSDVYAQSLLTEDVFHTCQLGCFIRPNYLGMGHEVSPYTSIPTSFYWVIVTMTTVGYGDLLPTTSFGRFLSIFVMYSGIFGLALPITVIGANFSRQYELLNIVRSSRAREWAAERALGVEEARAGVERPRRRGSLGRSRPHTTAPPPLPPTSARCLAGQKAEEGARGAQKGGRQRRGRSDDSECEGRPAVGSDLVGWPVRGVGRDGGGRSGRAPG